ncbi:hypothetical protein DITRI_Ditri16bG0075700 [Diplodiscus trichospermus]
MASKKPFLVALLVHALSSGMILLSKAAFNMGMSTSVFVFYKQVAGISWSLSPCFLKVSQMNTMLLLAKNGYLDVLVSCICWALWLVLQAQLLRSYPSKLTFTSIQCLSSAVQSFLVAIALERDPHQWNLGWNFRLLAVVYCGIFVTGVAYYLQAWVNAKKGPVFHAVMTPSNLVMTILGSVFLLGETINLGS